MINVYVLYSEKVGRYYVGMAENLEIRVGEHNAGKVKSTKGYLPWVLVHHESFESRVIAREREKYLKSAAGRRWRKKHIRPRSSTG
ncbi:MAG: GIY-YIG nuclease family protein [Flavobacteriaceae bacterium]|nr:GIY-YIG nuclease family protein [Flavobacteriaceae bacterium]